MQKGEWNGIETGMNKTERDCKKKGKRDFVLRTTSVSPLDRDKGTLPLTRENAGAFSRPDCWKRFIRKEIV